MRPTYLILLFLLLAGCGDRGEFASPEQETVAKNGEDSAIAVTDAVVRLPVISGRPGVAYLTIANGGENPAELVSVAVEGAERAEIHETTREGDAMQMRKLAGLAIQPAATTVLEPGGLHIMVFGLDPADPASVRKGVLTFADGSEVTVSAAVEKPGAGSDHGMDH